MKKSSAVERLDVARAVVIPVLPVLLYTAFVVVGLALSALLDVVLVMVGSALSAAALVMMILMLSVEAKRACPAANSLSHTSMAYILFPGWKTIDYLFY